MNPQNAYKTLSKQARETNKPDMYSLLGSGRNPRKHVTKAMGKHRDGPYYDSSEESGSPYIRSVLIGEYPKTVRTSLFLIYDKCCPVVNVEYLARVVSLI